ncbi:MAG: hypothetical protein Q4B93_00810 [Clostridia bacterium]|nr:hypothetical protein [Clostridia bacterium]
MKYYLKNIKNLKNSLPLIIMIFILIGIISNTSVASLGAHKGILYCVNTLIPSLFIFMIFTSFIVNSGATQNLSKILNPVTKFLFYLPGCTAPIIILSLIGGYPVGARGAKSLYESKEINTEQLNRLMTFSVNAGPAFIIEIVGNILLKNYKLGCLIFIVQVVLSLSIGIISGILARQKNLNFYFNENVGKNKKPNISDSLIKSCSDTSKSIIVMSALIVVFYTLIEILKSSLLTKDILNHFFTSNDSINNFRTIFISILEMTSGCNEVIYKSAPTGIIFFAVGFGGICAHLQIKSIFGEDDFNFIKFTVYRLLNGLLTVLFVPMVMNIFPYYSPTFLNTAQTPQISLSCTNLGSVLLVILALYFVICVNYKTKKYSR